MIKQKLNSVQDIKKYFQQDETAYYFISATNFNLMVMSNWVKCWFNINLIDCYNGHNKSIVLSDYTEPPVFESIESINQFLLGNKKIVEHIQQHQGSAINRSKALFLFYDNDLEKLVKSLDMDLIMPPNKLVKHIDNKIVTTEIGNSVDVPSVPNALVKITSYSDLLKVTKKHDLGSRVVIQTEFGDSGKTTFFISCEADYQEYADKIESEDQVKLMKHIQCLQVAMEACATRQGTYIGPILTEIIGHPKLTPYKGGWCGNDVNADIFSPEVQNTMYSYTEKLGHALYETGYRGYFEVDYLLDTADSNNMLVYLGEINPRVTGISALTNMSEFCNTNIPLFLFHLLEFSDTEFSLTPQAFNLSVREYAHPEFGQLIFKYTDDELKVLTRAPDTGVYTFRDSKLQFIRHADNPTSLSSDEIYILRIMPSSEFVYKAADILIVFINSRLQHSDNTLTSIADTLISIIHKAIEYRDLTDEEKVLTQRYGKQAGIKSSADSI